MVRFERENFTVQGQIRAPRAQLIKKYEVDVGATHRLMGWMVRDSAWFLNRFQIQSDGRTLFRNMHDKDDDKELVQFGEIC